MQSIYKNPGASINVLRNPALFNLHIGGTVRDNFIKPWMRKRMKFWNRFIHVQFLHFQINH